MRIVRLDPDATTKIGARPYEVREASSYQVAGGEGEAHVYVVRLAPGGIIGAHVAGFGQLFIALEGEGWVAGPDGERVALARGHAAIIRRGEMHSKGSETGLTALMIQVRDLAQP